MYTTKFYTTNVHILNPGSVSTNSTLPNEYNHTSASRDTLSD